MYSPEELIEKFQESSTEQIELDYRNGRRK